MKILFDLFPILLFFIVFRLGNSDPAAAHAIVTQYLSMLINGGAIAVKQGPIILATAVVIPASLIQLAYVKLRGRKIDAMLWVSCIIIVVFGGLTIYFHNENFIKAKPTILYWVFALALAIAQFGFGKNLMRKTMEATIKLPDPVWHRVGLAWMSFFFFMGILNLVVGFVIFKDNDNAWVNFKLFGMTGLFFAFAVVQMLFLSKYLEEDDKKEEKA
ncbi:septation protein A [Massilia glaciei]|uniref:Inner membrane-spanning protein YciB n=1 Tax=Massilia glaciei TaxID=1524097 RepID=A0A2U2HG96_9BURK|nr:septation protein A [Massilia glaciei]PWF43957.1 septation protein A [Massilia glaciei]